MTKKLKGPNNFVYIGQALGINRNQHKNIARSMHTSSNDLWVRSMKHDTKTREKTYRCSKRDEEKHVRT